MRSIEQFSWPSPHSVHVLDPPSAGLTMAQVAQVRQGLWARGPHNFTVIILIHTKYTKNEDSSVLRILILNCIFKYLISAVLEILVYRISTFLVMIDFLLHDLDKRIKNYSKVDELFSFLRHTDVEADVSLAGVVDFYCKDLEGLSALVHRSQTPTFFFVTIWLSLWRTVPVSAPLVTSNASNLPWDQHRLKRD